MNIPNEALGIIVSVVGSIFAILLAINAFFITGLVKKLDKAYDASVSAEAKIKGIDRVIRELTELKSDMTLIKYIINQRFGVSVESKKDDV